MSQPTPDLILLTTAVDGFTARLLAARLQASGIPAQVKGESAGPYPVSVGRLAGAPVFVPNAAIEEARAILTEFEEAETTPLPADGPMEPASRRRRHGVIWWVVAFLLVVSIFFFGPQLIDGIT